VIGRSCFALIVAQGERFLLRIELYSCKTVVVARMRALLALLFIRESVTAQINKTIISRRLSKKKNANVG